MPNSRLRNLPISRILMITGAVIILAGLGAAAILMRGRSSANANQAVNSQSVDRAPVTFDTRPATSVLDTDSDGLPNSEEDAVRTNPAVPDSDQDGLSDFDEVRIYRSDPLKTDSDDDGFADGDEVKRGFSPTGPEKLFEPIAPTE